MDEAAQDATTNFARAKRLLVGAVAKFEHPWDRYTTPEADIGKLVETAFSCSLRR